MFSPQIMNQFKNCFTTNSYPPTVYCDGKRISGPTAPPTTKSFDEEEAAVFSPQITNQFKNCVTTKSYPPTVYCDGKRISIYNPNPPSTKSFDEEEFNFGNTGGSTIYNPNPPSTMFDEEPQTGSLTTLEAQAMGCFTLKTYPPKYICQGKQYGHKEDSKLLEEEENPLIPIGIAVARSIAWDVGFEAVKAGTNWAVQKIRHFDEEEEQGVWGQAATTIVREVATSVIADYVKEGLNNGVRWVGDQTGWYEETDNGADELKTFSHSFTKAFIKEFANQQQIPAQKIDKLLLKLVHQQGKTLITHLHPNQINKPAIGIDLAVKYAAKLSHNLNNLPRHAAVKDEEEFSFSNAFNSMRTWQSSTLGSTTIFDETEQIPTTTVEPIKPSVKKHRKFRNKPNHQQPRVIRK
jgi:hypothetical protein